MNSTLQCFLHTSELENYFLNQFSRDFPSLKTKKKEVPTKGNKFNYVTNLFFCALFNFKKYFNYLHIYS